MRAPRPAWLLLAGYAAVLLWLAPRPELSLDEILTLIGVIQPSMDALLDYMKTVAGGTPLAFLVPRVSVAALGYSPFSGRLPSVLASVAACPAVYLLARRMGVSKPLLAAAVFALWPLQLRYALEARPYAFALACSVWSTEVFLSLTERRGRGRAALYLALTVLAALAQPYALFVTAAHLLHTWRWPAAGLSLSALALVPWYLRYRDVWTGVTDDQKLAIDWRAPLVLVHEIAGSGYGGTMLLTIGIVLGAYRLRAMRRFWLLCAGVPIAAVFVANLASHYFFAIRQTLFSLPALALLFTRSGNAGAIAVFLAASLYEDANWFRKPRENWQAAADAIYREVQTGACVEFLGDSTPVYEFFHPELARRHCSGPSDHVVVGTSSYVPASVKPSRAELHYTTRDFHGPAVMVGRR